MRKNTSRSKEIDLVINLYKSVIDDFRDFIKNNPTGGTYINNKVFFTYGNIERLIDTVNWQLIDYQSPIKNITGVYHLDSLPLKNKLELELKYQLQSGVLTKKSKADIFIVTNHNKHVLSFKDGATTSKLGQVSSKTEYCNAKLSGGLNLLFPYSEKMENSNIKWENTQLSSNQFSKLNHKDRCFAYFKNNYKELWDKFVFDSYEDAVNQLISFGNTISKDLESFKHFILITLFGRIEVPEYYNLLINDKLILSSEIIKFINNSLYKITCEHYKTSKKFSLIVYLNFGNIKYGITKIEPAFDGANEKVSQTKGIIYYFQQYPINGNNIWELLKNIPK